MPTLRLPDLGSRVTTQGSVMKRPASWGQHCRMGKSSREKLSRLTTSLQGPVATVRGKNFPASARSGSILILSRKPCGVFTSMNRRMRAAISSSKSTPRASFIRASEPNWLIRSWESGCPFRFWKRRAGPPGLPDFDLLTRSVISAISRTGSTSVLMRRNSPARSRAAIHWRRSSKGKVILLVTDDYKGFTAEVPAPDSKIYPPSELRRQLQDCLLNLLPGFAAGIDQVEVIGPGDLQQMNVFFLRAGALLLAAGVISAESWRDNVIGRAVDQPLMGLGDGGFTGAG